MINHSTVVTQSMDQCMAGCMTTDGTPVKKPTEWTANHEMLVKPMRNFMCDNRHYHAHPTGKELERLKLYPWKLCGAVVQGIQDLKRYLNQHNYHITEAYPAASTSTEDKDIPPRPPTGGLGCPACHVNIWKHSPRHTRKRGSCRWFDVQPIHYDCPQCNKDKGREVKGHLQGNYA